jgi:hypothetical protein
LQIRRRLIDRDARIQFVDWFLFEYHDLFINKTCSILSGASNIFSFAAQSKDAVVQVLSFSRNCILRLRSAKSAELRSGCFRIFIRPSSPALAHRPIARSLDRAIESPGTT